MSQSVDKESIRRKYDHLADAYSGRYADPGAIALRHVGLVRSWGITAGPTARVLEVGCADGFVTAALARDGFEVTAVDLAPRMVERTLQRLAEARLQARVLVGDLDSLDLDQTYDVVLAVMGTFFRYAADPAAVMNGWASHVQMKLIVDVDPRSHRLARALGTMRDAGFHHVAWRPLFV
ncbi:MAG: class I SAM-dependent methyltransferase, partial [Gaiellales bacterium]